MSDGWSDGGRHGGRDDRGVFVFGILLVLIGVAFLLSNVVRVDLGHYGWPAWVIVPGLALLVLGFAVGGDGGLGAAIPGGILTAVGILLAFQNATGAWASWAYAWALVAPGSIGLTLALYGLVHGKPDLIDSGLRTAGVGLALFVGFGLFFESFLNISEGEADGMRTALPALAVVLGVLIVGWNLVTGQRHEDAPPAAPGAPAAPGGPEQPKS